jgi:predicted O-methyltransferase YrrM
LSLRSNPGLQLANAFGVVIVTIFDTAKQTRGLRAMTQLPDDSPKSREEFEQTFLLNITNAQWEPHPLYSVFTQYDQEYYLARKRIFICKYKCFYAVSKTIAPKKIIEMGVCGGSSGDAYLSAAPEAQYLGIDLFNLNTRHDDHSSWDPYDITRRLFESRGFQNYQLLKTDLRSLSALPFQADFVIVDAAHDFESAYADLTLALTAAPTFLFVDDADDVTDAKPAVDKFLSQEINGLVDYMVHIPYQGGGLVIKLRDAAF